MSKRSFLLDEILKFKRKSLVDEDIYKKMLNYVEKEYPNKTKSKMLILFGIIGSLLIGSGIILLFAHNWGNITRGGRTTIVILLTVLAQSLGYYIINKKRGSIAFTEAGGIFLALIFAAAIGLIDQTYHIVSLRSFLIKWMILIVPIIYLLRSSLVYLLYMILLTWWMFFASDMEYHLMYSWFYFVLALPFFFVNIIKSKDGAKEFFMSSFFLLNLLVLISFTIEGDFLERYFLIIYSFYFALAYLITRKFKAISQFFFVSVSYFLTYEFYWESVKKIKPVEAVALIVLAVIVVLLGKLKKELKLYDLKDFVMLGMPVLFALQHFLPELGQLMFNLYFLALGISIIYSSVVEDNLLGINVGIALFSLLFVSRFFDIDMSFLGRGLVFIFVGVVFLVSNIYIVKRKQKGGKENETKNN